MVLDILTQGRLTAVFTEFEKNSEKENTLQFPMELSVPFFHQTLALIVANEQWVLWVGGLNESFVSDRYSPHICHTFSESLNYWNTLIYSFVQS